MTQHGPEENLNGRRVLVVEDSFDVAEALQFMLDTFGCEVVGPVGRLDQAMALAKDESLDLALLDINMDGRTIFGVADVLRERGVAFVFSTGYDASVIPPRFRDRPCLQKPVDVYELEEALSEQIAPQ